MRITEVSAAQVIARLPRLKILNGFRPEYDLFICASGFEDRATNVVSLLRERGVHAGRAAILNYTTNLEDNVARRGELEAHLQAVSDQVVDVSGESSEAAFDARLRELLPDSGARVLFDLSACSGRFILRVFRALFALVDLGQDLSLDVMYTCAKTYAPTEEEAELLIAAAREGDPALGSTLGLDYDADDVPHTIERAGQQLDSAAERAIVICGFNADRMRASLDLIDTSFNVDTPHPNVTYIAGVPHRADDAWRQKAMIRINSMGDDDNLISSVGASTLHYEETLRVLEDEYKRSGTRSRITVLPFGSKMQSFAVALFCEAHPDVRVQMLAPTRYRGVEYSSGIRDTYMLRVESIARVSDLLRSIGSLDISEAEAARPRNSAVVLRSSSEGGV